MQMAAVLPGEPFKNIRTKYHVQPHTNRPEDEIISERAPADTTPVSVGIKPWNATEPIEIQLPPMIRLTGERQSDGSLTPLRVCGYIFREADIENWQQLMLELKTYAGERADRGWSLIMRSSKSAECR